MRPRRWLTVRPATNASPVPDQATFRLRHLVALVVAVLGLLGALLAGWWGLGADRGSDHVTPSNGWVEIADGWVRLDEVADRSVTHSRMPNMQTMPDADPVPGGHVRYLVGLSVAADDRGLRWGADDILVSGTGMPPARPHGVELGDGLVPAGSTVSGTVTVDVPERARDVVLSFGDARLPLVTANAGGHTGRAHDDGHVHDDSHTHDDDHAP